VTTTRQREPEPPPSGAELSAHADLWIRQFIQHFEMHLVDASRGLPPNAGVSESQSAAARAVLETFIDSGMEIESALGLLGQAALEQRSEKAAWNDALNDRRFALIDKEIQGTLTTAESVELAGLTRMMREHVESETNLPMAGARGLHQKLLRKKVTGQPE
jgi:hypothetical protein